MVNLKHITENRVNHSRNDKKYLPLAQLIMNKHKRRIFEHLSSAIFIAQKGFRMIYLKV